MDPDDTAEHTVFECPRWTDNRSRMTEVLRRAPNTNDVEEILRGPSPASLPEDMSARNCLLVQAKFNHKEFMSMLDSIMTTKGEDERENETYEKSATNRRRTRQGSAWAAKWQDDEERGTDTDTQVASNRWPSEVSPITFFTPTNDTKGENDHTGSSDEPRYNEIRDRRTPVGPRRLQEV